MARKSPRRRLTEQQQRFIKEYTADLNATEAAKRAGYAPKSAHVQANDLLKHPLVHSAVKAELDRRALRIEWKADDVIRELALLGFSDIGDILDFSNGEIKLRPAEEISAAARRTIQSVKIKHDKEGNCQTVEFKLWDKNAALEKLGRHLRLFGNDPIAPADGTESVSDEQWLRNLVGHIRAALAKRPGAVVDHNPGIESGGGAVSDPTPVVGEPPRPADGGVPE